MVQLILNFARTKFGDFGIIVFELRIPYSIYVVNYLIKKKFPQDCYISVCSKYLQPSSSYVDIDI